MTARPILSECLRRPERVAVVLTLVMVAVLLVAGCAGQTGEIPVNTDKNNTQSVRETVSTHIIPLSDKELAEQAVADAEAQIKKTDPVIAWFKGNESTKGDLAFLSVITKREVAVSYVSSAKDELASGNYLPARIKAQDAFVKANESYNDAMERQSSLRGLSHCPIPTLSIYLIVFAILICIIPALLTALLFSMMKTLPSPRIRSLLQRFRGTRFSTILLTTWIICLSILLAGGIAKTQSFRTVSFTAAVVWIGLTLALMIISLIVLGIVVWNAMRSRMKKEIPDHKPKNDEKETFAGKYGIWLMITLMIVLILLMPLVIILGILFSAPPLCY